MIRWTRHAEERQAEWQKLLGVTREAVEAVLQSPGQVVPGDVGALIAQAPYGDGLLRVVYREDAGTQRILTLYWTSRVSRYWKGEGDAG